MSETLPEKSTRKIARPSGEGKPKPHDAQAEQAALERIARARELAQDDVAASMARLDMVVRTAGKAALPASASPARKALAAVLSAYGNEDLALKSTGAGPDEDVEAVARANGLRLRRLVLPESWWKHDHGHLVGFIRSAPEGPDGRGRRVPVALIRSKGYSLHDPARGAPVPVTDAMAAGIEPSAFDFAPPLPEKVSGLIDLGRFLLPIVRRDLASAALAGAVIGLVGALFPIATAMIVDTLIPGNELALLLQVGGGLAGAALLSFLFTVLRQFAMLRINGRTNAVLQQAVWDRLLKLPASFYRRYSSGDLTQRVGGVAALRGAVVNVVLSSAMTAVFSLFYLVLLFVYDTRLALLAIAIVLLLALATLIVGIVQLKYHKRQAIISGWLSGYVFQMLQGIVKLRVAGAEDRAFVHWAEKYADERAAIIASRRITNHFMAFAGLYGTLSLAAIYAATQYLGEARFSAGIFIAFLAAFGGFQGAFMGLSSAALQVISALPHWERARPIFETAPETAPEAADPGPLTGAIEVTNVTFAYGDSAPVLNSVSLTLEPGEHAALVGPSGSGKSTLIRLLLGLERPGAGTIVYDGQDIASLDLTLLRRQIGVVTQSGRLFAGSIMDNIRGGTSATFEECLEACRAAGFEGDLAQFPMGLHTPLTEGAATLSGGQRQRILIARALVSRPRILIFDEATSALDNRTQAIVAASLKRLSVTRLVIAHRLSTVQHADCIHVLDAGEIVESGTYKHLIARKGLFADLAKRQLA